MEGPWYVSAKKAAELSGIGRDTVYAYLNSHDPPPYIRVGNSRLIEVDGLRKYLKRKQEVR